MSLNIEDIYNTDALDAGKNFHVKVFPKINKNFEKLENVVDTIAKSKTINFVVNGNGSVITTGAKGIVMVPFSGTIIGWNLISDVSANTTIDVWKTSSGIPTNSDTMISSGTKPSLSSDTVEYTENVNWSQTSFYENDVFRIEVESNNNSTYLSLVLVAKVY